MFKRIAFAFCTTLEGAMQQKLKTVLKATNAIVEDVSGGCGSMYSLTVTSPLFKDVSRVK